MKIIYDKRNMTDTASYVAKKSLKSAWSKNAMQLSKKLEMTLYNIRKL